jgi:uncharacterized membrane protein YtjA (UPF0391 family)
MLTLFIIAVLIAGVVGLVAMIGLGSLTLELGKMLFFCAAVLLLISMVIGVARGRTRA